MRSRLVHGKPIRFLSFITLAVLVGFLLVLPYEAAYAQAQTQTDYYNRSFSWNYDGETWTWNLSIPASLFNAYVSVPDSVRTQLDLGHFGYFVTTEDSYMQSLALKINETATRQGYSSLQEENFALAFVQSIPYQTDLNSTGYQDYPRFPIETLVDNVGDCKSHSILFATLTLLLGFDAVFINPPQHLAVGVLGDSSLPGTHWVYNNQDYFYCETTGEGFTVGQLPSQFDGVGAYIYPIITSQQYVVNLQTGSSDWANPSHTSSSSGGRQSTSTFGPDTINTPSPGVAGPTEIPVTPVSLNLVLDNPLLFVAIIAVIAVCIALVVRPKRRAVKGASAQTVCVPTVGVKTTSGKVCLNCGHTNKPVAVYCESCGNKLSES